MVVKKNLRVKIMDFEYYWYKKFFSLDDCQKISHFLQTAEGGGVDVPAENVSKTSSVKVVSWQECKQLLHRVEDITNYLNQRNFGFEIYSLTSQDFVNYNIYESSVEGKYDWHKDGILGKNYDIKLTVIVNISTTQYEGGKFELFLNGPVSIDSLDEPGSILIFPSYFIHRVTPVTKGNRETISFWIHGPNFR
jgi:PKHD-type hydroxylase